jgi:hypothetical protein
MAMPSGSAPDKAQAYFEYMNARHQTDGRIETWTVDWLSLAWMWGFVAALALVLLLWLRQYRSTRERDGIYPVDSFGGYATERAGPATTFFLILTAIVVGFAVVLIAGHLIDGQLY